MPRYHYAVVEFDTEAAARHAYEEIDGTEFEATANIFDLRYVPEDTTFDDQPTDVATSASVSMQAYKPAEFVTDVSSCPTLPQPGPHSKALGFGCCLTDLSSPGGSAGPEKFQSQADLGRGRSAEDEAHKGGTYGQR